jgi:hypothetical protein
MPDTKCSAEIAESGAERFRVDGSIPFCRGKEEVFCGVLAGNELENRGPVSVDLKEERTNGVCEQFGLTFQQDTVSEDRFV